MSSRCWGIRQTLSAMGDGVESRLFPQKEGSSTSRSNLRHPVGHRVAGMATEDAVRAAAGAVARSSLTAMTRSTANAVRWLSNGTPMPIVLGSGTATTRSSQPFNCQRTFGSWFWLARRRKATDSQRHPPNSHSRMGHFRELVRFYSRISRRRVALRLLDRSVASSEPVPPHEWNLKTVRPSECREMRQGRRALAPSNRYN